jgi:uracil-DNA glycosylase family 4
LTSDIVECEACPRLVAWREEVARTKVARFLAWDYWGKPVPGFGDPDGRLVIVGLAPAAHGANRTGRMFTGDRSGDFLFAALHRAGLASQPTSHSRGDGLALHDTYILAAIRCAPPGNQPRPDELARCASFLDRELALLPRARIYLALGAIAWRATLDHFERTGAARESEGRRPIARPAFAHGAVARIGARVLLGSYHVSQQNTQTGRLTTSMFDAVLADAKRRTAP